MAFYVYQTSYLIHESRLVQLSEVINYNYTLYYQVKYVYVSATKFSCVSCKLLTHTVHAFFIMCLYMTQTLINSVDSY